jgi:uncharacterized membrane protein
MESNLRTIVKTLSYRTAVAISIFIASIAMSYGAGFGLKFVILVYTLGFLTFYIQERLWLKVKWGMEGTHELHKRTVAKTITWRIWSLIVLFVFGMVMGLQSSDAVEWTIVTNILFVVVHYAHERAWNLVSWRKVSV